MMHDSPLPRLNFAGAGRMLGFLEQQESPGGTLVAARRHTKDAWCSDSQNAIFRIFMEHEPPGTGFIPPSARFLISGC